MTSMSKEDPKSEGVSNTQTRRAREQFLNAIEARNDIRFAVGSNETGFSGSWIAWATRDDYYVGLKRLAGSLKFSLHPPNGEWPQYVGRLAVPSEFVKGRPDLRLSAQSRVYNKWHVPTPPEKGAHAFLAIVFPTNHL